MTNSEPSLPDVRARDANGETYVTRDANMDVIQHQLDFVRNKYEPPRPPPRPICHSLPTLLTHSPTLLPCLKIAAKRGSVFCVAEGNRKHQETQTGGNNLHFKGEFAIEKLNYFRKMF